MQRGCVSTLAASAKMARERSAGSEMVANADGGCNSLAGCAEPEVGATMTQKSNAMADSARIISPCSHRGELSRGQPLTCPVLPFLGLAASNKAAPDLAIA